ncbi:MAG TPA: Holliday junction resolvase RuvX [Vicinamibacterales bacterium]|jgi:putative Holliday junction resolvase
MGRIAAVDVGTRRIGIAVSDPSGTLARPFAVIQVGRLRSPVRLVVDALDKLASEDEGGLQAIVVGLPAHLDGTPSPQTAQVRAFAADLGGILDVPIVLQDERLSSREAESRLAEREPDWRKRKPQLDAVAAAVILQDYLDSSHQGLRNEE